MLEVSCLGYTSQLIPVGVRRVFDITMETDAIMMEGTVVTALGIKRSEKALSYNVQEVKSDELLANKDANFINSLSGKVAGLVINASSSGVGGASKVVMRGQKSISKSTNALYVIDGVPMFTSAAEGGTEFDSRGSMDPVSDLSKEKVAEALAGAGVDERLINDFVNLIDACEFARYSPDAGHDAMNAHYQDAINVISSMDSMMKGKKSNHASKTAAMAIMFMLVIPFSASAAGDAYIDSLWTGATAAYAEGRWEDAIDGYTAISRSGLESADLYCNIGSAYFKAEDYPHAVLYYERALKLDPSCSDARYNLEVVSGFIQDRIDPVPEFVLKTWTKSVCYILDSDAWAALFIVFLLLAGLMTVVLVLSSRTAWKRTGFFSGIVFLLLAVASVSFSLWQRSDYMRADRAVVMRPVTSVKSSPSDEASTDLFILHEGTSVRILDTVGDWNNIELADGRQGWIPSDDIEVI